MKTIILNLLILLPISILARSGYEIKGKVKDQDTNKPLFNCHVYLNENYGVLTERDGSFRITVPERLKNKTLKISYVGYETFQEPVQELSEGFQNIELVRDTRMLDDVVVVTADPWDNFRDAVTALYPLYDDKDELYEAILTELDQIDQAQFNVEDTETKASSISGIWSVVILVSIIFFLATLLICPLSKRLA